MPQFTPFRMVMTLRTQVVLTDFAPTLDAVLFEALKQQRPEQDTASLLDTMRQYLQFNEELGVFHASAMVFGLTPDQGLLASTYVRTDRHTPEKLSKDMILPNGRKDKYAKIYLDGGPTKRRLREMPAYSAPYAVFDAVGDAWAIKQLLEYYVLGLGYDALNCRMGAFHNIVIMPLETDTSLVLQGKANRPLPATAGIDGLPGVSPLTPPYYSKNKQSIVGPARVRSNMLNHLI